MSKEKDKRPYRRKVYKYWIERKSKKRRLRDHTLRLVDSWIPFFGRHETLAEANKRLKYLRSRAFFKGSELRVSPIKIARPVYGRELGEMIKKLRVSLGLTQWQLSTMSGFLNDNVQVAETARGDMTSVRDIRAMFWAMGKKVVITLEDLPVSGKDQA